MVLFIQAYQRLQIQQQMMQAQRNVSGPIRQQEQQVSQQRLKKYDHQGHYIYVWPLTQNTVTQLLNSQIFWVSHDATDENHRISSKLKWPVCMHLRGNRLLLVELESTSSFFFIEKEKEFVLLFEILVILLDRQCSACWNRYAFVFFCFHKSSEVPLNIFLSFTF